MAEPFAKPKKEDLKKALKLYGDEILYWATNTAVEVLRRLNSDDFDIQENQFKEWEYLTRRLFWKFGACQIIGHLYRIVEESAEEYWKNWTPPEIKQDQREEMIPKEWESG